MKNRRNATIVAAVTAALSVSTALGARPAQADEVTELRANQELLQRRIDQLAQARVPGNLYGVGGPAGPVGVQTVGGSFPRSFLIPGTDTSIRIGGEIRMNSLFWITGGNPNQNPPSTNAGTTGQVNSIPLKGTTARLRGDKVLNMSMAQSKLSVETRTPTSWGEARSFFEFDFAGGVAGGNRILHASNSLIPRARFAYGTLGPLLFGQANSNFNDADAGLETLDFGGLIGGSGPARIPQIRWTQPLQDWGLLGALSVSLEASETEIWAPGAGVFGANGDTSGVPGVGNVLKNTAPSVVAAWYIPQPWGHVDFAAVVRPLLTVEHPGTTATAVGIDRTFTGYAFNFSGDVKPRWFGFDRDYFIWGFVVGEGAGMYHYAGSGSTAGLVSNITQATLNSGSVLIKPTRGFAGRIGYRHEWGPTLRSNIGVGYWHLDVPGLNGAVCPASASRTSGGCALNQDLTMGVANLIWQPVSFVDIGLEYVYGRRETVSGANGDQHVVESRFRLRF